MRLLAAAVLLIAAATAQAADWMDMAYKHLGIETHEVKLSGYGILATFPTIPDLADLEATYIARRKEHNVIAFGPSVNATQEEKAESNRLRAAAKPDAQQQYEAAGDAYHKALLAYLAKRMADAGITRQKMQSEADTVNSEAGAKQQHVRAER